jgi:hypothetical protein
MVKSRMRRSGVAESDRLPGSYGRDWISRRVSQEPRQSPATAPAKGAADGKVSLARPSTSQQQTRNVRAGDQENGDGETLHNKERPLESIAQARIATLAGLERENLAQEDLAGLWKLAEKALLQLLLLPLAVEDLHGRLCLRDCDTRLQPREGVEPRRSLIAQLRNGRRDGGLHRDRHPDLRGPADVGAFKTRCGDADHREWRAVETDSLAYDSRATLVLRLPEVVLENGDRMTV